MAEIDDRAAELNRRLAVPDEEFERGQDVDEDQADEEPEDVDDEDQGDEDENQDAEDDGDSRGPRTRAAAEGAPALSAGLVLGFLAYSLVVQIFKGGTAQAAGWLKAKLINEPWQPPGGGG